MTASGAPARPEARSSDIEREVTASVAVSPRYPADVESPRAARHFVSDVMRKWGLGRHTRHAVELVATELAANAVVHANSAFSVLVKAGCEVVRVAVYDTVPIDPARLVAHRRRGLGLVSGLSRDWGVDVSAAGKSVWAEIDTMHPG